MSTKGILDNTCGVNKISSFLGVAELPVVEVQPSVVGSMSTVQPRARCPNQFRNGTNPASKL